MYTAPCHGRERGDGRKNAGDLCPHGRIAHVDESSSVAAFINVAVTGTRRLTPDELRRVLEHVAQAGFDPSAREKVRGRLAGLNWKGYILKGTDLLTPLEVHYVRHVLTSREWPTGTTMEAYTESIRSTILNPYCGVAMSLFQGAWQLTIVSHSGSWRGPNGFDWILIDYRVGMGHWMTAFQPREGLAALDDPKRRDVRWIRNPTSQIGSREVSMH